jgi:hypothetical protein
MLEKLTFQNQVNAVGGLAFLVTGSFFAYEFGRSRDAKPCGTRYPSVTQMSLQKPTGEAMSPAELQARAGNGERGVLEKASVIKVVGAPAPLALSVEIGGNADTGASFFWAPGGLQKATSACLSYQVFLPKDFDFAKGGQLPGLFGIARNANQRGFATRFTWDEAGNIGVEANLSDYDLAAPLTDPVRYSSQSPMPRGRWVQLEQEITLNTPNAQNGMLRLWVDGRLKHEDNTVAWRGNGGLSITGARTEVSYRNDADTVSAKKPVNIIVSPPQLSWN